MISLIEKHKNRLSELCRRFMVWRLDLFGSAVTERLTRNPCFRQAINETQELVYVEANAMLAETDQ